MWALCKGMWSLERLCGLIGTPKFPGDEISTSRDVTGSREEDDDG
jgi:hypothetical protein